ncbi:hypothetical protein [Sulfurovum sp. NBC37-1]|uniref:hypothetical protein n=1 Tax=Sulfurovum sp. (strain NBC37-1) TaxID=387093 RepID=UPI0001587BD5|nr:hypothetical protein [Sulfurovum sp. NBC37-1]BAF73082.1 hypothetical protein SUN_2142 [Sulfurovum sp. NBC37-1]
MINDLTLFDCTIREAGYQTGWFFDTKFAHDMYSFAQGKGIDYLELGFFHDQEADPNRGIYRYCSQKNDEINRVFDSIKGRTKLSAMRDIQRPLSELIPKKESVIDAIRIINRSHENNFEQLEKEVDNIRNNGYEAFVNFTSAGYNDEKMTIEFAKFSKKIGLDIIYFADTESVFTPEFVSKTIDICKAEGIEAGMHLHDKNGTAEMLLEVAINKGCKYTDATLLGLGGKWHDGNLTIEHMLRRFGLNGGYELTQLKTDLVQQLIKYNKHSTAILD